MSQDASQDEKTRYKNCPLFLCYEERLVSSNLFWFHCVRPMQCPPHEDPLVRKVIRNLPLLFPESYPGNLLCRLFYDLQYIHMKKYWPFFLSFHRLPPAETQQLVLYSQVSWQYHLQSNYPMSKRHNGSHQSRSISASFELSMGFHN